MALLPFVLSRAVPEVTLHLIGGTYCKEMRIPAGMRLVSHKHKYDHMAVLVSGRVRVVLDGLEQNVDGPRVLNIPAGIEHGMVAITEVVWLCIHATHVADPEKVDETLIEDAG